MYSYGGGYSMFEYMIYTLINNLHWVIGGYFLLLIAFAIYSVYTSIQLRGSIPTDAVSKWFHVNMGGVKPFGFVIFIILAAPIWFFGFIMGLLRIAVGSGLQGARTAVYAFSGLKMTNEDFEKMGDTVDKLIKND